MNAIEKLRAFKDATPTDGSAYQSVRIPPGDIEELGSDAAAEFNNVFSTLPDDVDGAITQVGGFYLWRKGYKPIDVLGLPKITRVPTSVGGVFRGPPDARQSASSTLDSPNPFRPQYRQLSVSENELHDDIKRVAYELWKLYDRIGTSPRDVALARTHLEDSVMRAVRGLTA